jgi:hypothetical protein
MLDPVRINERKEQADPIAVKSRTDKPNDPDRALDRSDIDEPIATKSNTEQCLPARAKDLRL